MEVLISWSKPQSKSVATCLRTWLPKILPGLKPWMSDKDIDKGKEWLEELHGKLDATSYCVIVVTPENVLSPWIYFEAGAISKGRSGLICPYLVGISPSKLAGNPLSTIYQCTEATRNDTWEMVKSINKGLKKKHEESLLEAMFDKHWAELEERVSEVPEQSETPATEEKIGISPEATEVLVEARVKGRITASRTNYGLQVHAGTKAFVEPQNPRSQAKYEAVLQELLHGDLIRDTGHQGQVFALTPRGFEVADAASGKTEQPVSPKVVLDESDIRGILLNWFNAKSGLPQNGPVLL